MAFIKNFEIANPSTYKRNDFVEVDMNLLGVPAELDETSLKLYRLHPGGRKEEIPYQIDYILGNGGKYRSMTFLSGETQPSGSDRYDIPSASFSLEEAKNDNYPDKMTSNDLWIKHYYADNPLQGSMEFQARKPAVGVEFNNNRLCFYFCLVPDPQQEEHPMIKYTGAVTSLEFKDLERDGAIVGEMLSSKWQYSNKRWGQLTHVSFFPLLWRLEEFETFSLLEKKYELVYSHSGPIRAVIAVKCGPFDIAYNGAPIFETGEINIQSHIYRILYIYRNSPYYIEEILSETCKSTPISFRPYFSSTLHYPHHKSELKRFEDIPDYFSIWKFFAGVRMAGFDDTMQHRGFGFAADAHVRNIQIGNDEIHWRLPFSHHNKCVHYFMQHGLSHENIDLFNAIGQYGWYEKVFKPLEVIPYKKRFPAPTLDDLEPGLRT